MYYGSVAGLWAKQLEEYPGSVFIPEGKLIDLVGKQDFVDATYMCRAIIVCLQFPVRAFYMCSRDAKGRYRYMGCRYGLKGYEYMSGFGGALNLRKEYVE